jgi:hypothetical protein
MPRYVAAASKNAGGPWCSSKSLPAGPEPVVAAEAALERQPEQRAVSGLDALLHPVGLLLRDHAVGERLVDLPDARVAEGLLQIRGIHAEALRNVVEKGLALDGVVVALRLREGHAAEAEEGRGRNNGHDAFGGSRGHGAPRKRSTVT